MPILSWQMLRMLLVFSTLGLSVVYTVHQLLFTRNWDLPLQIVIYPINADGQDSTQRYIDGLREADFLPIDGWMKAQAARYQLPNPTPTQTRLGPTIQAVPPPFNSYNSAFKTLVWGLKMRWWAYQNTPSDSFDWRTVKIYMVYRAPSNARLPHSLGLQKGLIGLVHVHALKEKTAQNTIIATHEMLHTVGATDKYDSYGIPMFPIGYANPNRQPLYPQRAAEIMAGRIPTARYRAYMALSLKSVVMGMTTAEEINWLSVQ